MRKYYDKQPYQKALFLRDMSRAAGITILEAKIAYNAFVAVLGHRLGEGKMIHLEDVGTFESTIQEIHRNLQDYQTGAKRRVDVRYYALRFRASVGLRRNLKEALKNNVDTP
jgi:nucleoid DNA-binding protein